MATDTDDLKGFVEKLNAAAPSLNNWGGGKYAALQRASYANQQKLARIQEEKAAMQKAMDETLFGRLDIDHGSAGATLLNAGANFVSGVTSMGGSIAAIPDASTSTRLLSELPEDVLSAYNRVASGNDTEEDRALLNSPRPAPVEGFKGQSSDLYGQPWMKTIDTVNASIRNAKAIEEATDLSSWVDPTAVANVYNNSKDAWRKSVNLRDSGIEAISRGDIWGGLKDIGKSGTTLISGVAPHVVDNPTAVIDLGAQALGSMAPMIAGSVFGPKGIGAGLAATGSAVAGDTWLEAIREFQQQNDGAFPTKEEMESMRLNSLAAGATAGLGDALMGNILKAARNVKKSGDKVIKGKTATSTPTSSKESPVEAENRLRNAFKVLDKVPGSQTLKTITSTTAKGTASEFGMEGLEAYFAERAKPGEVSGEEVFASAVLGGLGGGGLSGGASTVAGVIQSGEAISNKLRDRKKAEIPSPQAEAVKKAKAERNAEFFTDPKSEFYDPVEGAAIYLETLQDESSTPESKEQAKTQAATLLDTLESSLASTEELISNPPTKRVETLTADNEAKNTELTQLLDTIANTTDPEELSKLKQQQADLETAISRNTQRIELYTQMGDTLLSEAKKTVEGKRDTRDRVKTILDRIDAETPTQTISDEDIKSSITTLASSADAPKVSPSTLLTRLMAVPDSVNPEDLISIANNTSNSLTENERTIARQFAESRRAYLATKDMLEVNNDIRSGNLGDGFYGVEEHRANIVNAMQNNRPKSVDFHFNQLSKLSASHQQKLDTFLEAREQYRANPSANPRGVTVYKEPNKPWVIGKPPASVKEKTVLEISNNSNRLINAITSENDYIKSTLRDMSNLRSLSSESNTNTTNSNTITNTTATSNNNNSPSFVSDVGTDSSTENSAPVKTAAKPVKKVEQETPAKPVEVVANPKPVEAIKPKTKVSTPPTPEKPAVEPKKSAPEQLELFTGEELPRVQVGVSATGNANVVAQERRDHADENGFTQQIYDLMKAGTSPRDTVKALGKAFTSQVPKGVKPEAYVKAVQKTLSSKGTPVPTNETNTLNEDSKATGKNKSDVEPDTRELDIAVAEAVTEAQEDGTTTEIEDLVLGDEDGNADDGDNQSSKSDPEETRTTLLGTVKGRLKGLLVQSTGEKATGSARPLASVPRFMATLANAFNKPVEGTNYRDVLTPFLDAETLKELDNQEELLENFIKFYTNHRKDFLNVLPRNFTATNHKSLNDIIFSESPLMGLFVFRGEDANGNPIPVQFGPPTAQAQLEDNVIAAAMYSTYTWLAEGYGDLTTLNNKEKINALLSRPDYSSVSPGLFKLMTDAGTLRSHVQRELGSKAIKVLGLRETENTPKDLIPKMTEELGGYALKMLLDTGFLVESSVPAEAIRAVGVDLDPGPSNIPMVKGFRKFPEESKAGRELKNIREVYKGSGGFLHNLFGVTSDPVTPTLEPQEFTQQKVKDSTALVPKFLKNLLSKVAKEKWFVRPAHQILMQSFGTEFYLKQMGWVKPTIVDGEPTFPDIPANLRASQAAKNDAAERELESLFTFIETTGVYKEGGVLTPFYMLPTVWKNFRVGLSNNLINPVASKFIRQTIYNEGWEREVDINDPEQVETFLYGIASAFGFSTDRSKKADTLKELNDLMDTDLYRQALQAVHDALYEEGALPEDMAALEEFIDKQKEGLHVLSGLIALAEYEAAKADTEGDGKFKVINFVEVDGVSNGPILYHLLHGISAGIGKTIKEFLYEGGIFEKGSANGNYNDYRSQRGNKDHYESFVETFIGHAQTRYFELLDGVNKTAETREELERLTHIISLLDPKMTEDDKSFDIMDLALDRNFGKGPVSPLVFGSSVRNVVRLMEDNFFEKMLGRLTKIAPDDTNALNEWKTHVASLVFSRDKGKYEMFMRKNKQELLDYEFTDRDLKNLSYAYNSSFGKVLSNAIREHYYLLIDNRDKQNEISNLAFLMYDETYKALKNEALNNSKTIPRLPSKDGKPGEFTQDISVAEDNAIRKALSSEFPILNSIYSLEQDSLSVGIPMASEGVVKVRENNYKSYTRLKADNKAGFRNWTSYAYDMLRKAPGTIISSSSTHSFDSWVAHRAESILLEKGIKTLNIHDAKAVSEQQAIEVAKAFNQATLEGLIEYSPALEANATFQRSLHSLAKRLVNPNDVTNDILEGILKNGFKVKEGEEIPAWVSISGIAIDSKIAAYENTYNKLMTLLETGVIDQYAYEGGSYKLTPDDYATIEEKLAELQKSFGFGPKTKADSKSKAWIYRDNRSKVTLSEVQQLAVDKIVESLKKRDAELPGLVKTLNNSPTNESEEVAEAPPAPVTTTQNILPQVAKLGAFLKSGNKPKNARDALRFLWTLDKKNNTGFKPLIGAMGLFKSLDNVSVEIVTQDTDPKTILNGMPEKKAFGWTATDGSTTKIYLMDSSFAHGGINATVFLHEALHATVADYIKANPDSIAVQGLETLRTEVEAFLNKPENESLLRSYANAVENVDELVSWGMSNRAFQKEVLSQITVERTPEYKKVLQQLGKTAIDALTDFYFRIASILGIDSKIPKGKEVNPKRKNYGSNTANASLHNHVALLLDRALKDSESLPQSNTASTKLMEVSPIEHSSEALLDAINSNQGSPEFTEHLKETLNNISSKVFGPLGIFKEISKSNMALTPQELYVKSVEEGVLPFTSSAINSGIKLRPEEALVVEEVEATVRTVLEGKDASVSHAKQELMRLYQEARNTIKPEQLFQGDWNNATPEEKNAAQKEWDFIFKLTPNAEGKLDYLSRFTSFGLGSEKVNNLLKVPSKVEVKAKPQTIGQKLKSIFNSLLDWANNKATGVYKGMPLDAKLKLLVDRLVRIEQRRVARLKPNAISTISDKVDDFTSQVSSTVGSTLSKILNSQSVKQVEFAPVQKTREALNAIVDGTFTDYVNARKELRFKYLRGAQEFAASVVDYMQGPKELFKTALETAKGLQGIRQDIQISTRKAVLNAFADKGKNLSEDDSIALSDALLRTGAHTLMVSGNKTISDIHTLLEDEASRKREIASLESNLKSFVSKRDLNFYLNSAKDLAHHRIYAGFARNAHQLLNANNIARMVGLDNSETVSKEQSDRATPIIEQLIALYGFEYLPSHTRTLASTVMATESARTDGNGVEFILNLHAAHAQEAKESLFKGQEVLMTHGYTMDTYNPNIDFRLATEEEGKELILMGYTRSAEPVQQDNQIHSNVTPIYAYSMDTGRPSTYTSGITSLTDMHLKGSDMYSESLAITGSMGKARDLAAIKAAKKNSIESMFTSDGVSYDPRKKRPKYAIPVLNPQGEIANYRYEATKDTRDLILERENRMEELLAIEASHSFDKESSLDHNRKVVELLHKEYLEGFTKDPKAYVKVSPNSSDPKIRELYRKLPEDMKRAINTQWGSKDFLVRRDLMLVTFGNSMPSLANAFKDPANKSYIDKMLVMFVEGVLEEFGKLKFKYTPEEAKIYAKQAPIIVRKFENGAMDIVREVKDLIVIKSIGTLIDNIKSNIMQLWISGVSIPDIFRNHVIAFKGVKQYQSDTEELMELQIHEKIGTLPSGMTHDKLINRINVLNDSIERNPVTPMMRANMMTSIVEDISENIDPNSYTAKAKDWVKDKTDRVSPVLTEAINVLTLGKDTAGYQFLNDFTRYSDFMARFTLMQHRMNTKKNPSTFEEARREAMDMFINYDIPLPPALQYTDAIGLTLFTKYFLSIQKVIYTTLRNNTFRALRILSLNDYLTEFSTIMDSSVFNRFSTNPLNTGPFKLLEVVDELPIISVPYQLIR